jgi:hypothetical protein
MSDECDYCGATFEAEEEILIYACECLELYFCDASCACSYFVEDLCEWTKFCKEES